jgi:hypothetical protein
VAECSRVGRFALLAPEALRRFFRFHMDAWKASG